MSGELKKMVIESFGKEDRSDKPRSFTVMFNPNTYGEKYEISYKERQGKGNSGGPQIFDSIKPQEYSFEFLFDGTGTAAPQKVNVREAVDVFLDMTGKLDGEIHRPRYLKISWGSFLSWCVLKSADVTYTLFKPDGDPLRAKVKATFAEDVPDELRVKKERKSSPDLTHVHEVRAGERLALLAYRYYGDASRYFQVARFNNLTSYRLKVGQRLAFPPIREVEAS